MPAAETQSAEQVKLLILQTRMTRGLLMRSLEGDLSDAQWHHQSLPCRLNIAWIAGHLALVLDGGFSSAMGGRPQLPESYKALFGMGTQATGNPAEYPSRQELLAALDGSFDRYLARLETLSDDDLVRPIPEEIWHPPTISLIGEMLSLANTHTAYHCGQIGMLRRTQGLPTGLGR